MVLEFTDTLYHLVRSFLTQGICIGFSFYIDIFLQVLSWVPLARLSVLDLNVTVLEIPSSPL